MSDRFTLICNGKRYRSITLDEARRILVDVGHYSYGYVKQLLDKVNADNSPMRRRESP